MLVVQRGSDRPCRFGRHSYVRIAHVARGDARRGQRLWGGIAKHALGLVVLREVEFHLHQNQQRVADQRSVVRRALAFEADRSRGSKRRATAADRA